MASESKRETIHFNNGKKGLETQNAQGVIIPNGQSSILPEKVVAIYSGEEDRLRNHYFDDFLEDYKRSKSIELPKMLLLNKTHWDIALLCLLYSDNNHDTNFLKELLAGIEIADILFDFNTIPASESNPVVSLIKSLQKEHESLYTVDELMGKVNIDIISLFQYLYFAKSQQKPLIDAIRFRFNKEAKLSGLRKKLPREIKIQDYGLQSLSEGQKKQLLFVAALEFAGQQNTLFLLDEPDVHVHIGNKKKIIDKIKEYSHNRHIIVTTHSPTLCKYASKGSIMLVEKGVVKNMCDELEAGKYLADDADIFRLLFTLKHIVVTEGKTDYQYIKKAIELYSSEYPDLIDIEFVSVGGTDGEVVREFLTKIRDIEGRKVIILVDRDEGGLNCARILLKNTNLSKNDIDYKSIGSNKGQYLFMIPSNKTNYCCPVKLK